MKVIRRSAITEANERLISSNVTDSTEDSWTAAGSWNTGDLVQTDASSESSVKDNKIYQSLTDANSGNDPALDSVTNPVNWKFVGSTNKWKMFNDIAQDKTSEPDSIVVSIKPGQVFDSVALIKTNASTVRVQVNDPVDGDVYDSGVVSLISTSGITDLFKYFFEPIVQRSSQAFTGIPPYANATVTVTMTVESGNCECGVLAVGQIAEIGKTLYGAALGILDYSQKPVDPDTGLVPVTTQSNKQTSEADVSLSPASLGATYTILESLLNEPAVWIVTDSIDGTIVFGLYKDFNMIIDNFSEVICRLEIGNLT